jgi:hypothetical protein
MTNIGRLWRAESAQATAKLAAELARGIAKEYAEYRYICGIIEGWEQAERLLGDIEGKM